MVLLPKVRTCAYDLTCSSTCAPAAAAAGMFITVCSDASSAALHSVFSILRPHDTLTRMACVITMLYCLLLCAQSVI